MVPDLEASGTASAVPFPPGRRRHPSRHRARPLRPAGHRAPPWPIGGAATGRAGGV